VAGGDYVGVTELCRAIARLGGI